MPERREYCKEIDESVTTGNGASGKIVDCPMMPGGMGSGKCIDIELPGGTLGRCTLLPSEKIQEERLPARGL